MNTGGAFNDRSIHTMNAGLFLFFFPLFIIWQCETTMHLYRVLLLASLRVIESCRVSDIGEIAVFSISTKRREIAWDHFFFERSELSWRSSWSDDSRRFVASVAREKIISLLPISRVHRGHYREIIAIIESIQRGSPSFRRLARTLSFLSTHYKPYYF